MWTDSFWHLDGNGCDPLSCMEAKQFRVCPCLCLECGQGLVKEGQGLSKGAYMVPISSLYALYMLFMIVVACAAKRSCVMIPRQAVLAGPRLRPQYILSLRTGSLQVF